MKLKEIKRDAVVYFVLLFAGLITYVWIIPKQIYYNAASRQEAFNPDTFPKLLTLTFLVVAAIGLVNLFIKYMRIRNVEQPKKTKKALTKKQLYAHSIPFIVFILTYMYSYLFKRINFIVATIIILPSYLIIIGSKKWKYYLISYLFAAAMFVLFHYVLSVPIY